MIEAIFACWTHTQSLALELRKSLVRDNSSVLRTKSLALELRKSLALELRKSLGLVDVSFSDMMHACGAAYVSGSAYVTCALAGHIR